MDVFFNNFCDLLFDIFRASCVFCDLLGTVGGIAFVGYLMRLFAVKRKSPRLASKSCRECKSFETCVVIMGNDLPGHACAYFKNKKL